MPIKPENRPLYSRHWRTISAYIRFRVAGNCCQFCGARNHEPHPMTRSRVVLTTLHLDQSPRNSTLGNLRAGCQRCHLGYDAAWRRDRAKGQGRFDLEAA